jgi:hypothetical protein
MKEQEEVMQQKRSYNINVVYILKQNKSGKALNALSH